MADRPPMRWLGWATAPAIQILFVAGAWSGPEPLQIAVECGLWAALAAIQWKFAPKGTIWDSDAWPAVLLVALVALRVLDPLFWLAPVLIAGFLFLRVLTDVTRRLPLLAAPLVLLAGFIARYLILVKAPVLQPHVEIAAPFEKTERVPYIPGVPIVWITVDTLRSDARLRAHDRIAWKGSSWDAAMSTSSWTVPALGSLHTGEWPGEHGAVRGPGGFGALQVETVAEQLAAVGYDTAAFVTNPFASRSLGFGRGFNVWMHPDEDAPQLFALTGRPAGPGPRDAARVVDHALDWLHIRDNKGAWFLWIHLMDPHLPYDHAPPEHAQAHDDDLPRDFREGRVEISEAERQALREAYADEVRYTDTHLNRLVDALEDKDIFDRAFVVSTSDHGEEFWEHGGFEHGHAHVPQVVDVRLAVAGHGAPIEERTDLVSLADVGATTLLVGGVEPQAVVNAGFDLREPIPADRIAIAEGNLYGDDMKSARRGDERWMDGDPDVPAYVQQMFDRSGGSFDPGSVNADALRELGYLE